MGKNNRLIWTDDLYQFCNDAAPDKITGAYTQGQANIIRKIKSAAHNPDALHGVDVEPVRHGYWEMDEAGDCKCSVCGEWRSYPEKYCPECGAKMDEEE